MSAGEKKLNFTVPAGTPQRLDKLLLSVCAETEGLSHCSRSQIKLWIEGGAVCVNAKPIEKAGAVVGEGARVEVLLPAPPASSLEPYDFPLTILFEDEALLVLDKPAGISMHPGAGNRNKTVVNALISRLAAFPEGGASARPGVVHRLDKDTSGVVVLAKNVQVHAHLVRQFSARSVERAYQALVYCPPRGRGVLATGDSGCIESNLGRDLRDRKKFAVVQDGGRRAVSRWQAKERLPYAVLVEVRLETGRTHQIRVHMDSIGAPIVGDKVYGACPALPGALKRAAERFGRQALHAYLLGFSHPQSGERMRFESALPPDFVTLLNAFRAAQD